MTITNNPQMQNMELNTNLHLEKKEKIEPIVDEKKKDIQALPNIDIKESSDKKKGKVATKLEELNKSKVTVKGLEDAVKDIKKEDNKDEPNAIEKKKKKPSNIDPKDLNKDGKISEKEKEKAKEKDKNEDIKDPKDLNKDGKVSQEEQQKAKEKKTLSLVKEIVTELKKETKDIDEKDFKNISKMINEDIIKSKESSSINKFLDHQ